MYVYKCPPCAFPLSTLFGFKTVLCVGLKVGQTAFVLAEWDLNESLL